MSTHLDQPYLLEATQDPTGWWRCVARSMLLLSTERITVAQGSRRSVVAAGEGPTMEDAIEACERELAIERAELDARLWPE